jgi:hypothetical protein
VNKKLNKRRIFSVITALILILAAPAAAFATDISVTADSNAVKAGDTVTVSVTVSAEHIAAASGVFTYDPALLSYISSNGGASDGYINMISSAKGGASSLTAVIKFKAISEGEAEIYVTMESVLAYDEKQLENAEAGVSVKVESTEIDNAGTTGGATDAPVDISLTGVAAENVMGAEGEMYVWRSLTSLTLPSGFYDRQITYKGEYVGGAEIPDREDLALLYLSDKAGKNAGYYIYDEKNNMLFPYLTVVSVYADFTLIWPGDSVAAPEGFKPATLKWKEKDVPAWTEDGDDSVYLIYARDSAGETGFYLYNTDDKSVQRYKAHSEAKPIPATEPTAQPAPTQGAEEPESGITLEPLVMIAFAAGLAVLAAAAALFAVMYFKARGKQKPAAAVSPGETVIHVKDADI